MNPRWLVALIIPCALLQIPADPARAAAGGDGGTASVLVKSRVPLTPEVAAAIGSHAVKITFVWPEIDAMAVVVNAPRLAELQADPLVAAVEPDQQGQAPGREPLDDEIGAAPLLAVPLPSVADPIATWNQDMADTAGTGYDGTGVTVAVVDSGLPQNWPGRRPWSRSARPRRGLPTPALKKCAFARGPRPRS